MNTDLMADIDEGFRLYKTERPLLGNLLADCRAEIQRLLLANETLKGLCEDCAEDNKRLGIDLDFCRKFNTEYAERIKALEAKGEPVAWMVDTEHYGVGFSFSDKFLEAFPNFPNPPSVDALIAEIDGLATCAVVVDGIYTGEAYPEEELVQIIGKYRSAK